MKIIDLMRNALPLLLIITVGIAEANERGEPVLIEAAEVMIDEPGGVSTYRGEVLFQQGAMILRADQVKVHSQGSTLHQVEASGSPVSFEILNEQGERIRAQADTMNYQVSNGHLLMEGNAELWQVGNHFSGGRIEFDAFEDRILASRQGEKQRVRVVIQPETIFPNDSISLLKRG